jgi:hypothetical protein
MWLHGMVRGPVGAETCHKKTGDRFKINPSPALLAAAVNMFLPFCQAGRPEAEPEKAFPPPPFAAQESGRRANRESF